MPKVNLNLRPAIKEVVQAVKKAPDEVVKTVKQYPKKALASAAYTSTLVFAASTLSSAAGGTTARFSKEWFEEINRAKANPIVQIRQSAQESQDGVLHIPGRKPDKDNVASGKVQNYVEGARNEATSLKAIIPDGIGIHSLAPAYLGLDNEAIDSFTNKVSLRNDLFRVAPFKTWNPNDAQAFVNHLAKEKQAGRKVVFVAHSFGGNSVTGLVKLLKEQSNLSLLDSVEKVVLVAPSLKQYEINSLKKIFGENKVKYIVDENDSMELYPNTNIVLFPGKQNKFKADLKNIDIDPEKPHQFSSYVNENKELQGVFDQYR